MQRTVDRRNGMETTEREALEIINWTEGQEDCRVGRVEKLKPGAERTRLDGTAGGHTKAERRGTK